MFIPILITILVAVGLYFYMNPKKKAMSPQESAKADVENLVKSMMREMKKMATAVSSPDFDPSSARPMGLALQATQTALNEMMTSVHQEFGIAIIPPREVINQLERGENIDIDSVTFEWVSCPKNFEMNECWRQHSA